MVTSAQIPYSIFNFTAAYGNNFLRLSFPTGAGAATFTNFDITIPDGFYTIDDLTAFFQQFAISNGLYLINSSNENVYYTPKFILILFRMLSNYFYMLYLALFLLVGLNPQIGSVIQLIHQIERHILIY